MDFTFEELVFLSFAMHEIPLHHAEKEQLLDAVKAAMRDTNAPTWQLEESTFKKMTDILIDIYSRGSMALDEACLMSLLRVKRELGWNPFKLPTIKKMTDDPTDQSRYLILRNAIGLLALAWQIRTHPNNLTLTCDDFNSL